MITRALHLQGINQVRAIGFDHRPHLSLCGTYAAVVGLIHL